MTDLAIQTRALRKVYKAPTPSKRPGGGGGGGYTPPAISRGASDAGANAAGTAAAREVVALEALDLEVKHGEFFGLLGPNGAGKTTTLGILTTRVRPTSGTALVAGRDVVTEEVAVKQRIGVVPQRPNADRALTAIENLLFHAAYFGIGRSEALARSNRLIEQLAIAHRRDAKTDTLSGGELQRLMIARALVHEPDVLFLDEPTVGLDPQARLSLWEILRNLHAQGRTIVMTTHYMEEADRLCDRLAIVDRGKLLALDGPKELKARAPGGTMIELALDGDAAKAAESARSIPGVLRTEHEGSTFRVFAERGGEMIPSLIKSTERENVNVLDLHVVPPSLETLFISLTGRKLD